MNSICEIIFFLQHEKFLLSLPCINPMAAQVSIFRCLENFNVLIKLDSLNC